MYNEMHNILELFLVWNKYGATLTTNGRNVTITPNYYLLCSTMEVSCETMYEMAKKFVSRYRGDTEIKIVRVSAQSFTIR